MISTVALLNAAGFNHLEKRLEKEKKLGEILEKEKKKLGIENKAVKLTCGFNRKIPTSSRKIGEDLYEIFLNLADQESGLQHELYHIADGHCDKYFKSGWTADKWSDCFKFQIYYLFYAEPKATIYEWTGLELGVKSKK